MRSELDAFATLLVVRRLTKRKVLVAGMASMSDCRYCVCHGSMMTKKKNQMTPFYMAPSFKFRRTELTRSDQHHPPAGTLYFLPQSGKMPLNNPAGKNGSKLGPGM
jgi:hypothetical protein